MTQSPEISEMLKKQLWRLHNRDYGAEDQEIEQLLMQQRELMEERLRRGYEELEDQGLLHFPGYLPQEEARRRLTHCLDNVFARGREQGEHGDAWIFVTLDGMLTLDLRRRLALEHLERVLASGVSNVRAPLINDNDTPSLELLQVLLPEGETLEDFLARHEPQESVEPPRGGPTRLPDGRPPHRSHVTPPPRSRSCATSSPPRLISTEGGSTPADE